MPRNLIICCDGTNNQFGRENTNVVRLAQVLDRDPAKQLLYYDPGVGTLPEPGVWSAAGKWLSKVFGLAFGGGIFWKVEQAYTFLMDHWEPGDRVYLFGFSRGAYTARLLAAVLHQLGLLPRGNYNLVPYVMRLFKAVPVDDAERGRAGIQAYLRLGEDFRWSFARLVPESQEERRFHVHFLGLWDTVSSVGWVWDPPAYPFTARNPSVDVVRHAISIDERRWFFRQNLVNKARDDQDLQEMWFPGVHADVGGGYPEADGQLWLGPLRWMLEEATSSGLLINQDRLNRVLKHPAERSSGCLDKQHESLTLRWWPAEFFPKWRWRGTLGRKVLAIGAGRHRIISGGSLVHQCGLTRIRDKQDYQPPNLSKEFLGRVRALSTVPEALRYES